MSLFVNFLISVMANVISYYVCKRLGWNDIGR
jgi:hypothetical protein